MIVLAFLALAASDRAAEVDAAFAALLRQDIRLNAVGYRLASGAAALCDGRGRPAGVAVDLLANYGGASRTAAARAGIGAQPTVIAVAPGSPGERGGLVPGDHIVAVDDAHFADQLPPDGVDTETAGVRANDAIEAALADSRAELTVGRAGATRTLSLLVPSGCRARFAVRPGTSLNGYADGLTVQLTTALVDFALTDGELGAAVAHELAHNILGHPQTLKASGRTTARVRATETAADRLSIYLLDAAGFSFADTLAFWTRYGPKRDYGILSDRSHDGWRARIAAMTAEHDRIERLRAAGAAIRPPADLLP